MPQPKQIQREELAPGSTFLAKADGRRYTVGNVVPHLRNYARYEMLAPGRRDGSYLTLYIIRRSFTRC